MYLVKCPCCDDHSLVVTMNLTPFGYDVQGKCTQCGYGCDSANVLSDMPEDMEFDYSGVEERGYKD
jgi:hypothetical protein